jgi:hypothetical protein
MPKTAENTCLMILGSEAAGASNGCLLRHNRLLILLCIGDTGLGGKATRTADGHLYLPFLSPK